MAYGDGLENRCSCKGTVGSNPTPSAILKLILHEKQLLRLPINGGFLIFANRLLTASFQHSLLFLNRHKPKMKLNPGTSFIYC